MGIDCGRCVMRGTGGQDCVVATIEPPGTPSYPERDRCFLDEAEVRAISVLADAGLVPPLRLSLPGSRLRPAPRTWVLPAAKAS
jgi:hypothetical protein